MPINMFEANLLQWDLTDPQTHHEDAFQPIDLSQLRNVHGTTPFNMVFITMVKLQLRYFVNFIPILFQCHTITMFMFPLFLGGSSL